MSLQKLIKKIEVEARKGDPLFQVFMGFIVENLSTERNSEEAEDWYRGAAENGFAPGMYALALLLGSRHHEDAKRWLVEAARCCYAPAQFALASLEIYNTDEEKQSAIGSAIGSLIESSKNGYIPASIQLSNLYSRKDLPEIFNMKLAIKHARTAAERGSIDGATLFGMLALQHGEASQRDEAISYLRKSAESGDSSACSFLSTVYQGGLFGVQTDLKLSKKILRMLNKKTNY